MNHLTDLQCSMYIDEALPAVEVDTVASHIESCSPCRARLAEFVDEKRLISTALNIGETVAVPNVVPKFSRPVGLREFAIANVITGLVVWLAQFLWKTLFGELIVNAISWITLIPIPDAYGLLVSTALYIFQEGTTMIETYLGFVILSLFILSLTWLVFSYRKVRATSSLCLLAAIGGSLLTPPSANAIEIRRGDNMVTIAATETVDDTLIIVGDTVVIDGKINGDLIAIGHRVIVNGSVGGNLIAFAETVTVQGQVGGTVLGAASSFDLSDVVINGDFWGAAGNVNISRGSRIGGNAMIATELASIAGYVSRDLFTVGENVELSGTVGEDFEAYSHRVTLLGDARVGGNLRFRHDENNLQRSSTAVVDGKVEILPFHSEFKSRNKYVTGRYYLGQLLRLASAFIFGIALLWFVPSLRGAPLSGGIAGLKTAGIGLVTLISLPIIMLLFAITVVGLPFTLVGFFSWLLAIYFAKIVLASTIGQLLLSSSEKKDSLPLTLLAGLVVILIAVNIPAVGGIFNFILTIVGIGMIVQLVLTYISSLDANPRVD